MNIGFNKSVVLWSLFSLSLFPHPNADEALSFLQSLNCKPVGSVQLDIRSITSHKSMRKILLSRYEEQNNSIRCGCIFITMMYLYLSMEEKDIRALIKLGKKIGRKLHADNKITNLVIFSLLQSSERMFVLSPKKGYKAIEKHTEYYCSLWLCSSLSGEKFVSLTEQGPKAHTLQEWKEIHAASWDDILHKRMEPNDLTMQGINDEAIELAIQLELNDPHTWTLEAKHSYFGKSFFDEYEGVDAIIEPINNRAIRLNKRSINLGRLFTKMPWRRILDV